MMNNNPWQTQKVLMELQFNGEFGRIPLSNGEQFNLTEATTLREMYLAQSRCVCSRLFCMVPKHPDTFITL